MWYKAKWLIKTTEWIILRLDYMLWVLRNWNSTDAVFNLVATLSRQHQLNFSLSLATAKGPALWPSPGRTAENIYCGPSIDKRCLCIVSQQPCLVITPIILINSPWPRLCTFLCERLLRLRMLFMWHLDIQSDFLNYCILLQVGRMLTCRITCHLAAKARMGSLEPLGCSKSPC